MVINQIKFIIRKIKNSVKYSKYRNVLPKNPMHDDIYIVEFPKSGITWLQHILGNIELQLAGRKNEYITFYNHHKYLPDIHQARESYINRFLNRTFIKSHSEYNPYYYFVIYLIRNPFDVMVSYYNFMCNFGFKKSFDEFVKSKKYGILRWKAHINSWIHKRPESQKIHIIRYEDLIKDSQLEIHKLYKNLGVNIPNQYIISSIKQSNINNMTLSENHYKKYNPNYNRIFIGKKGKFLKENLLTEKIKNCIFNTTKSELEEFYPEMLYSK